MKTKKITPLTGYDENSPRIELCPLWRPDRFQQWRDDGVEILIRVLASDDLFRRSPANDDPKKGWYRLPRKMSLEDFQANFPGYTFQYFADVGKREGDKIAMREYHLKYFRQAFAMAHIFYEIRKLEGYDYNPETGRVVLEHWPGFPEGMPAYFTQIIDPEQYEKEQAEYEARESDIVNESNSWVRLLPDGRVEIWRESNRWDLGRRIPSVDIDEAADAVSAMCQAARIEKEFEEEDPVEFEIYKAEQKARSGKVLLAHHEDWAILTMGENYRGTVEIWGYGEKYNPETGDVIERSERTRATFIDDSDEAYHAVDAYRFNMFSELRSLLFKAVQSEAPEHYAKLFPLSVKLQILNFALAEIAYRHAEKKGWEDEHEVKVFGHGEFMGHEIRPQIEYTLRHRHTNADGVVSYEWSKACADLAEAGILELADQPAPIDTSGGMRDVFEYADSITDTVKQWEAEQEAILGKEGFKLELERQLRALLPRMLAGEGFINGWSGTITVNPNTLEYNWEFHRRDFPLGDRPVEAESARSNPDNPHCAELSELLSFVL